MKYIYSFFFATLFFLLVHNNSFAQLNTLKEWHSNDLLNWSDFKGAIDTSIHHSSMSYYSQDYTYKWRKVNNRYLFKFEVVSHMHKNTSWVMPAAQTPELLKHEQLHFDISEFFARQLKTSLNSAILSDRYQFEIEEIVKRISAKRDSLQNMYDEQTKHSLNIQAQKRWQLYVQDILNHNYSLQQAIEKHPQ